MVLYLKYRPQTLGELFGQEAVKLTLNTAISSNKLAHAYLFCGPRGSGKTSTARILAKIVNCEAASEEVKGGLSLPCNLCGSCISITDGSSLDVVEMDAASNRGIEDIRILRDNIKLAPVSSRKKVYIIDEVHQLSAEAFNALLKTLEEPPSHVIFILATTEVQKIPVTILSRVQRLDFKSATIDDLSTSLREIAKAEKLEISEDALMLICKKGGGSFRDCIKLLDQLSGYQKIDLALVEDKLSLGKGEQGIKLLEAIAQKNTAQAVTTLIKQLETGVSPKEFNLLVLDLLRGAILVKNCLGEKLVKIEMEKDQYELLESVAAKFSSGEILRIIDLFQKSLEQLRYTGIPSLPLEVAVISSCLEGVLESKVQVSDSEEVKTPAVQIPKLPEQSHSSSDDIVKIQDRWEYILETVKQFNFSLEALLRSVKIVECGDRNVVLEVPYSFHQRILETPKSRDPLEAILSEILGRSIRVSTILGKSQLKREELANVEIAQDDEIVRLAAEIFNTDTIN
ncbi:MAG: DNA polymerase III subunit gamma/tau [Candidatus Daviesbacteria bacterium]|nr:DNA polymerase III subunit gamma/tau [Candidatus Daviesbacteria bacterium]